ncbi:MAG: hypothetical protein ACI4BA_05685 [Prevotella sp.]
MKKLVTLVTAALFAGCAFAQSVELSWATMIKDDTGNNAADQNNIRFYSDPENSSGDTGFILQPTGGRTQAGPMEREYCSGLALNFKNNNNQTLVIPEGTKVYKINFYGWSQGSNWSYLYAYGPSPSEWEWTDPIGSGIMDNTTIIDKATYPLDPCTVTEADVKGDEKTTYHNAGYCFASIDFGTEPYEGTFSFVFNGNNQERAWMVVYTSLEAAAAAEKAESPRLGKDKSQNKYISTGINAIRQNMASQQGCFNLQGQKVNENYKGVVIKGGKKLFQK